MLDNSQETAVTELNMLIPIDTVSSLVIYFIETTCARYQQKRIETMIQVGILGASVLMPTGTVHHVA